jgi:putative transposase
MHPIAVLCRAAGVSRSGYYRFAGQPDMASDADSELASCIRMVQEEVRHIYGYRRMKIAVEEKLNVVVNKKRIARIQRETALQARIRRKRYTYHRLNFQQEKAKPNILKRDFTAQAPNRKWLTDITYIPIGAKQLYVSAILDVFNREVVAHRISESIDLPFVLETFSEAFENRDAEGVMIHSDQGTHYTSRAFCSLLREHKAIQSMSRRGVCLDNAAMENFFGLMKSEIGVWPKANTQSELVAQIHDYIGFYNNDRIQEKLKMAPVAYRICFEDTL